MHNIIMNHYSHSQTNIKEKKVVWHENKRKCDRSQSRDKIF